MPCQLGDISFKLQGKEVGIPLRWVMAGSLEGGRFGMKNGEES